MSGALVGATVAPSRADSFAKKTAKFASGEGAVIYFTAGTLLPLLEGGKRGRNESLRVADALLTSTLITEGLKRITRQQRPGGSEPGDYSFPSGHATAAFAIATMQSHFHPRQATYWYLGATLIAASRVQLRRHFVRDVVAGAAVGYGTARLELSRPRGLLFTPFISRDAGRERHGRHGSLGLQVSRQF